MALTSNFISTLFSDIHGHCHVLLYTFSHVPSKKEQILGVYLRQVTAIGYTVTKNTTSAAPIWVGAFNVFSEN